VGVIVGSLMVGSRPIVRAVIGLAATGALVATSLIATVAPAQALAFSNQDIAAQASYYAVGSEQGPARDFAVGDVVNPVLASHGLPLVAGAGATGGEYYGAYQSAGAVAVDPNSAMPGDLIQTINDASKTSDTPPTKGLHTAIVVATTATPGSYVVRDSNFGGDNKVSEHTWAVSTWATAQNAAVYVWRFGSPLTNLIGTIVQWPGTPNTSWLVYPDLTRRWIPSPQVFNCLRAQGVPDSGVQPAAVLDQIRDRAWESATCTLPPAPTAPDMISVGRGLTRGSQLTSRNGLYSLLVSPTDGSITLYKAGNRVIWSDGAGSAYYVLQADGAFVGLTMDDRVIFTTATPPPGYVTELVLTNDGDLQLLGSNGKGDSRRSLWTSHTAQRRAPQLAVGSAIGVRHALYRGHSICSANGVYCFTHQRADGALVLRKGSTVLWHTGPLDGDWVTVRTSGDLVDMRSDGKIVWSAHTAGTRGTWLSMRNDGNLVLYSGHRLVWNLLPGKS